MKQPLRRLLVALIAATCLPLPAIAQTQAPADGEIVHLVLHFPPGQLNDTISRAMADKLRSQLKAPVIVDNRAGASGAIAARYVAAAKPDGRTLFVSSMSVVSINPVITESMSYDPYTQLRPVAGMYTSALVLAVPADKPWKSLGDLLKDVRASEGRANYGAASVTLEMQTRDLLRTAGAQAAAIRYAGTSQVAVELVASRLDFALLDPLSVQPLVQSGKLRVLAVTGQHRLSSMPDIPTVKESGIGADLSTRPVWVGVFAPAKTPQPVAEQLAREFTAALDDPEIVALMNRYDVRPLKAGPKDIQKLQQEEMRIWTRVMQETGMSKQ
jgi:tripartite-type tricarboxylate transporter receptor subunit TctC